MLAVVILLAVQQIDSNFIYPKVVGSSTGLKPLVVLLAVSVFGYFGGIVGMLLAVPLAGIIQIFRIEVGLPQRSEADPCKDAAEKARDLLLWTDNHGIKKLQRADFNSLEFFLAFLCIYYSRYFPPAALFFPGFFHSVCYDVGSIRIKSHSG